MKGFSVADLETILAFLAEKDDFVFLDTSRPDQENCRSYLFVEPLARLQYRLGEEAEVFLSRIEGMLRQGYYLAGWFGYEFGSLLEERLADWGKKTCRKGQLLADLGIYGPPQIFDHRTGEGEVPPTNGNSLVSGWQMRDLQPNVDHRTYLQAIKKLKEYIAAGDTYQVNYTLKLLFCWTGSPEALYLDLRHNQTVPYGAYMRSGGERILSFSPELFFRKDDDQGLVVRPMKGTSRRGDSPEEDKLLREGLSCDEKNRSENVMIVDLLRNDLARLIDRSGGGEVRVSSLFDVETYESLLQMTSTVEARFADQQSSVDLRLSDIFHTLFPCGSVTGAPKIRTMEIIAELEKEDRGVYTGAIGYLAPDSTMVFNVPIRTVVLRGDRGEMGIGSGIIHDSDPEQEWRECLLKGRFLSHCQPRFELLETMLWQPESGYWLLDDHLARLARSAGHFYFAWSESHIREELQEAARSFARGCMRVRLALAKDGTCQITVSSCEIPEMLRLPETPIALAKTLPVIDFSDQIMQKDCAWLQHKTTHREIYDEEFNKARERGLFDMVFLNGAGEVTEGCITNIILCHEGKYSTPLLGSGLLPGVMRGHLLADLERPLRETVLRAEDVRSAEAIYLCNSVRGLVQVALPNRF